MANVADQLDTIEKKVMSGLKDFQKATVERIDYLYRHDQRRVLVSDEVGLGKTLIARGTVAKLAKLRRDEGDDLVKVVYICSNAAIADQNLQKLRLTKDLKPESTASSRLSMQHLNIFNQENDAELLGRYIQLIPLTPDTSFRMTTGPGMVQERALMFAHLRRLPELQSYLYELDIAMQNDAISGWNTWCKNCYESLAVECDDKSSGRYFDYMQYQLHKELAGIWHDDVTYMDGIIELCRAIRKNRGERVRENHIIGQLRVIFAKISLDKLEPDLVIMDEFQRFRYLLNSDPESETGMLAKKFFQSPDLRMLLLSATPYKMYSTPEEIDENKLDEHYIEFLSVMKFLNENPETEKRFLTVWRDYSIRLKELTIGDTTILKAKDAAEDAMYQTVCRTERISAAENADIIDDSDVRLPLEVLEQDIRSTGFYHNKAKNLIACANQLLDEYDGQVPSDIDQLTKLAGVGRKTANVIRGNIYDIPSIVVDTHVGRISRKLGLTKSEDPVKVEKDLEKCLPKDHWILWNIQIIAHGRSICTARSPKCNICCMKDICDSFNTINNK